LQREKSLKQQINAHNSAVLCAFILGNQLEFEQTLAVYETLSRQAGAENAYYRKAYGALNKGII